ncbi:VOC family protein, partial [Mycolicibacterium porcinum]|uniref:VOC family protein n=1 Tax=Mycolicibacterium porcinum TaxID=39693 RepID=UPI000AA229B0
GGNRLAFDTEEVIAGMHPGWTRPAGPGRVALAFGLDVPADVDALYERLTAAGHPGTLKPFDAPWGQRYATVEDPDGTSVDLFAALGS